MRWTLSLWMVIGIGFIGSAGKGDEQGGHYRVEVESIVAEGDMLVQQFLITAPQGTQLSLTDVGGKTHSPIEPAPGAADDRARAKVTILATVNRAAGDSEDHLFKVETEGRSWSVSGSSKIQKQQQLKDLLTLTAKSGKYKLGEPLQLGMYQGHPVTLLVKMAGQ